MIRLPAISEEEKQYLQRRGYTPFAQQPLESFYRPLSWQYQLTNLGILGITVPLRSYFKRKGFLYFPLTLVIVSVPFFNLLGLTKFNSENEGIGARNSRQHFIDHLPKVTRQAYTEIQKDLKFDIEERERQNRALRQQLALKLTL